MENLKGVKPRVFKNVGVDIFIELCMKNPLFFFKPSNAMVEIVLLEKCEKLPMYVC